MHLLTCGFYLISFFIGHAEILLYYLVYKGLFSASETFNLIWEFPRYNNYGNKHLVQQPDNNYLLMEQLGTLIRCDFSALKLEMLEDGLLCLLLLRISSKRLAGHRDELVTLWTFLGAVQIWKSSFLSMICIYYLPQDWNSIKGYLEGPYSDKTLWIWWVKSEKCLGFCNAAFTISLMLQKVLWLIYKKGSLSTQDSFEYLLERFIYKPSWLFMSEVNYWQVSESHSSVEGDSFSKTSWGGSVLLKPETHIWAYTSRVQISLRQFKLVSEILGKSHSEGERIIGTCWITIAIS